MMTKIRNRIIHFLQLSQCRYVLDGHCIQTCNARLTFTEHALLIERDGKPNRLMPYEKLNLDRLLFLINPAVSTS